MSELSGYILTVDFWMEGILISNNNLTSKRFSYPVSTTGRTCHGIRHDSIWTSQLLDFSSFPFQKNKEIFFNSTSLLFLKKFP